MKVSNSRRLSLEALLTALAVILNLAISFPAPYATFLQYEIWEVPIVLALLILGLRSGVTVAILNSVVLELVKPGALPAGPFYNFAAIVAMFVGILAAQRVAKRRGWGVATLFAASTSLGVITRTSIMTVVNAIVLPLPYPFGFGSFGVTVSQVPALLLLIGLFNFTVALYTIPLAYSIQRAIAARYRLTIYSQP
ncbi:MAG TPA: ECF transporter S component [Nitrososphaerales archaeon]|nr:ECF transporter S component [Nitrososphaerales archaeon]